MVQGCHWEVIKNAELHSVVSLCVCSTREMPQRGQDRSSKGAEGEEYVLISDIISSDLDELQKWIFWYQKKQISVVPCTGIPDGATILRMNQLMRTVAKGHLQ